MLGDGVSINVLKYGVACVLSLLAFLIIFIFRLIFGSYILGAILFVVIVWLLIFKIGITIMYPGSSNYFTSDIQMRMGSELAKNYHHLGHCFQFVAQSVVEKKVEFTSAQWNLKDKILGSIHSTIEMLSMFENTLSPRKAKMLQLFRSLLEQIESRHSSTHPSASQQPVPLRSISQFLQSPKRIGKTPQSEHRFLCEKAKKIIQLSNELQAGVQTYKPPESSLSFLKYKFWEEKLYEVRFGYQRWNHLFDYEVHLISNVGCVIESAIIKRCKSPQLMGMQGDNHHPAINGKHIMFCNPNGVYIQFFAVENTYIKEYLKQGYQIILWNYRGYGQSTGSPSITKSQTDAMKVYNYFTGRGLKIELVHGYSIGGCAAIGLVSKLEKRDKERSKPSHVANPKLRAQALQNNIKLIIVDRSFSSIGDMAIEFGSTLHRLARIVFTFENKNLSEEFIGLKGEKLLLWDKYDEVIPDTASVKCGVLVSTLGEDGASGCSNCSKCMKSDTQNQLNEEREEQEENSDTLTKRTIQKFIKALKTLLQNSSDIHQTTEVQLNTNHEYDPTSDYKFQDKIERKNSDHLSFTQQVISQVFNALQQLDGGGCLLPHPVSQLRKTLLLNPISFEFGCKSYILGLAYYGSVIPVDIAFMKKTEIQLNTITKIQQLIKALTKISQQNAQTANILEPQLTTAIQNIIKTFAQVKNIVEEKFLLPENNKFGKLIPLSSGHNGSLPQDQLKMLMNYVRQVCVHNQDSQPNQSPTHRLEEEANSLNQMQRNSHPAQRNPDFFNSTEMTRNSNTQHNFLD